MKHTVEGKTLSDALKEAEKFGFEMASLNILGTWRPISEMLEELTLDSDAPNPADYIWIDRYIFRVTDAWGRDAEIIELD